MTGEILRSTIKTKIPTNIHYRLTAFPTPDTDDEWLDLVVKLGKIEEAHKKETQVLNDSVPKPKDKGKGKETAKTGNQTARKSSDKKDVFTRPVNWKNLTEKEKEDRKTRLGNISKETI